MCCAKNVGLPSPLNTLTLKKIQLIKEMAEIAAGRLSNIRSQAALRYLHPPEMINTAQKGPLVIGVTGGACGGKVRQIFNQ